MPGNEMAQRKIPMKRSRPTMAAKPDLFLSVNGAMLARACSCCFGGALPQLVFGRPAQMPQGGVEDLCSADADATETAVETDVGRSLRSGQGVMKADGRAALTLVP